MISYVGVLGTVGLWVSIVAGVLIIVLLVRGRLARRKNRDA